MRPGDHQWQARQGRIGSSELGALTGTSPWATPQDVYRRVLDLDPPQEPNVRMRMGNALEPVVLEQARIILGLKSLRCWRGYVHPTLPWSASPDAYAAPHRGYGRGITEVKTTSAVWADQPPDYVLDQVQGQLLLTGKPVCHVVVLQGTSLREFAVESDPVHQERLEDTVATFCRDHLWPRREPINPPFSWTTQETDR